MTKWSEKFSKTLSFMPRFAFQSMTRTKMNSRLLNCSVFYTGIFYFGSLHHATSAFDIHPMGHWRDGFPLPFVHFAVPAGGHTPLEIMSHRKGKRVSEVLTCLSSLLGGRWCDKLGPPFPGSHSKLFYSPFTTARAHRVQLPAHMGIGNVSWGYHYFKLQKMVLI